MKNREKELLKEELNNIGDCWAYRDPKIAFYKLLDFTKELIDRISSLEEIKV